MHNLLRGVMALAAAIILFSVSPAASARTGRMKMLFFPSAASFFLPDGGLLVVDFGKGLTPGMIAATKRHSIGGDWVYRILSACGWRPRIDWLIMTARSGQWDYEFVKALASFNVAEVCFPFDIRKNGRALGQGSTQLLLQLSLSNSVVNDLSTQNIDLFQSVSSARWVPILPVKTAAAPEGDDGREAVCFIVEYGKVRILVAGELTEMQQRMLLAAPERIKAGIFFHPDAIDPALINAVGADYDITFDASLRCFSTNGETISPEEP